MDNRNPDVWPERMQGVMAARRLGISPQRVSQLVASGKLDREDGKITADSVRRYMATREQEAAAEAPNWKARRTERTRQKMLKREAEVREQIGSQRLLTYDEAAQMLDVSSRTLRRILAAGDLVRVELDHNHMRVTWESLQSYINFGPPG